MGGVDIPDAAGEHVAGVSQQRGITRTGGGAADGVQGGGGGFGFSVLVDGRELDDAVPIIVAVGRAYLVSHGRAR